MTNQPITNQPITNQPITNQPITNQPITNQQPSMRPYGRQILICNHGDCADSALAEQLNERLMALCREHGLTKLRQPHRVKCTLADCLGVCQGGPILVVYPDGIWYHHVDEAALVRIFHEHLLGGKPVEEFVFHRLYPAGQEIAYPPAARNDAPLVLNNDVASTSSATVTDAAASTSPVFPAAEPVEVTAKTGPDANAIRAAVRRAKQKKGLIIVNTGEGKGKTTAALGVMTRAWGRKLRIGVIQFLKNENARFGEIKAAARMGEIDWIATGDGWTWTSDDMDETTAKARHAWSVAQARIISGNYDLLILDEFTYPLHYGWLDSNEVLAWLEAHKPPMLHIIITGRYAPQNLIDFADLVTEMRMVKHPFAEQGIRAQAGIEY